VKLYAPLIKLVVVVVLAALAVRLAWELLAPALVPISLLVLAGSVLLLVHRRR
jgi:hypothetical protein